MKLPELETPEQYGGLYVFDFGEQVAVGYTAEEIAVLLESDKFKDGKVYRIHRALPDGTMELQGVARERFLAEEGMCFYRRDLESARKDFEVLTQLATQTPPPCRMKAYLARWTLEKSEPEAQARDRALADKLPVAHDRALADKLPVAQETYATVIIYPAEYSHDVSNWLSEADYEGGDYVEGGISAVTAYYTMRPTQLEQRQWWPAKNISRSAEEVLATTHLRVQRRMAG